MGSGHCVPSGWGPAPPAQEPLLRLGDLHPRVLALDRGQQVSDMVLPLLDTLVRVRRPAPAPVAHGSGCAYGVPTARWLSLHRFRATPLLHAVPQILVTLV